MSGIVCRLLPIYKKAGLQRPHLFKALTLLNFVTSFEIIARNYNNLNGF